MSAEQHLSGYGVTMDEAYSFIIFNLNNLSTIFSVCQEYGVTTDMISEILSDGGLAVDGQEVANYFASNGLDATDLGGTAPNIDIVTTDDSSLASVLAGKTIYTAIWGTPETLESWTFNEDATAFVKSELYGFITSPVTDTLQVTVNESSIDIIDVDQSSSTFQLAELTDDYVIFDYDFGDDGFLDDSVILFFEPSEAESYFSLSTDWLSGVTLYTVWYGSSAEENSQDDDVWVIQELIFGEDGTLTINGLLNSISTQTTYDVSSDGLLYQSSDSSSGNVITGASEEYFLTDYIIESESGVGDYMLDGTYYDIDNTDYYFYNQQDALAFVGV